MLPEISRRCVSCGAAVRVGARFCPQCGNGMSDADAVRAGASSDAPVVAPPPEPEPPRASSPATREVNVASAGESSSPPRAVAPEREAQSSVPETGESESPYAHAVTPDTHDAMPNAQAAPPQQVQLEDAAPLADEAAAEEKRGRVARVREGTRARVENTRARVERVKGDALVALEDAPDDSGLRFVAVAAVLFVLFIAFLFLSVTVLR